MKSIAWQAFIPLSATLTSCSVTIYDRSVAVRTLACPRRDAHLGDALVNWNGQDSAGHAVKPGTYRWRLNARNGDGTALAANSGPKPIQGQIVVH